MPLNRPAIKFKAKQIIAASKPSVIAVGVVYLVAVIIINFLSARLLSINMSTSEVNNYMTYAMEGDFETALEYAVNLMPPTMSYVIDAMLAIVLLVLNTGFIIFLLNTMRSTEPCFGNLMDGFAIILKLLWLNLLMFIFITLWGLLLVVPGIIAAFRYSQAIYILIDDPSKSAMECLKESKCMMAGHKWEYFMLQLSFFGWMLLASLPTVGYAVQVWTIPYIGMVCALYYERLAYGRKSYEDPVYTC